MMKHIIDDIKALRTGQVPFVALLLYMLSPISQQRAVSGTYLSDSLYSARYDTVHSMRDSSDMATRNTSLLKSGTGSQNTGGIQDFTPNTFAFMQYGNSPVDYSQGMPNIELPLYTLEGRDLSFGISLSYLPSGITVDQEATTVGLGWCLNAGGMITREVRGIPDRYGYNNQFRPSTSFQFYPGGYSNLDTYVNCELQNIKDASEQRSASLDSAPDCFVFNFCGKTGKFYLDNHGIGKLQKYEDLRIEFANTSGSNGCFRITDEKGVIYEFCDQELLYSDIWGNYTSSWYLSSITCPTGEKIELAYVDGSQASGYTLVRTHNTCYIELQKDIYSLAFGPVYKTPLFRHQGTYTAKLIRQVTHSSGAKIVFDYSTQRSDCENGTGYKVTDIKVYNSQTACIRHFHLGYGYFEPDYYHRISSTSYNFLNYRLKLISLHEISPVDNTSLPPYRFYYYGDNGEPAYQLPYRMSPCQDHWGYYNNTQNDCLFPGMDSYTQVHMEFWLSTFSNYSFSYLNGNDFSSYLSGYTLPGGADRHQDSVAVRAGTLHEIVYPTGGSTVYDFEAKDASNSWGQLGPGGLRVREITDYDRGRVARHRTFEYLNSECGFYDLENLYHFCYFQNVSNNGIGLFHDLFMAYGLPPQYANSHGVLQINAHPARQFHLDSDFSYTQVVEHIDGKGRIAYEYSYYPDVYSAANGMDCPDINKAAYLYVRSGNWPNTYIPFTYTTTFPYFPYMKKPDTSWKRGNLIKKTVFGEVGGLIEKDDYLYDEQAVHAIPSYSSVAINDYEYILSCDYLFSGLARLREERHTLYDGGRETVTVKSYSYDANNLKLVHRTIETQSDGNPLTTFYYYPSDYGTLFQTLVDKHILSPIDTRQYKNGWLVGGKQVQYNGYGQPMVVYKPETQLQDIAFNPADAFTFSPMAWYLYDSNGLLRSETLRAGAKRTDYIWSYNRQYPVAVIENPTASQASLISSLHNTLVNKAALSSQDKTALNLLRTSFPSSHVSVFHYMPSVGMTEQWDMSGKIIRYGYDNFYRLKTKSLFENGNEVALEKYLINFGQ